MNRVFATLLLSFTLMGCREQEQADDAGVGSSRDSCGEPGSNSVLVSLHSCACADGYTWCSDALDEFDCCPVMAGESDTGPADPGPDLPCDETALEQLVCLGDDPPTAVVWACNGERWVPVPGYADFACQADGFDFAFGCLPGPTFPCGHGPGSPCEVEGYPGICVDAEIIDTCVWGRRTVDYCARLCAELHAFGDGFTSGSCEQPTDATAFCTCT
jgi:hypothetical protein